MKSLPTISTLAISPFDATTEATLQFTFNGAQCVANTLTVYSNDDNTKVYTNAYTYPSYVLFHKIPANTLTNGNAYRYEITGYYRTGLYSYTTSAALNAGSYYFTINGTNYTFTTDAQIASGSTLIFDPYAVTLSQGDSTYAVSLGIDGTQLAFTAQTESVTSAKSQTFWCFSTPKISVNNIKDGDIINTQNFNINLSYSQNEGEQLSEYLVLIENSSGLNVFNSGALFSFSKTGVELVLSEALQVGTYRFVYNGISRSFTTTIAMSTGDSLHYDSGDNVLTAVIGGSTTTLPTTQSTSGTLLVFPTVTSSATLEVDGLINNSKYSLSVIGVTQNGMSVSLSGVGFWISYTIPSVYSVLTVENMKYDGIVRVSSNMAAVDGKTDFEPQYIDGTKIDLTGDSATVVFDSGFNANPDFTLIGKASDFVLNKAAISLSTGSYQYTISFHQDDLGNGEVFYGTLKQNALNMPGFVLLSNAIQPPSASTVRLFIAHNGANFTFQIGVDES